MSSTIQSRRQVSSLLNTPRRPPAVDNRAAAIHECGHAIVGLIRKLHVELVVLEGSEGFTATLMHPNETPSGYLQMLHAGYVAEVVFGYDPVQAMIGAAGDVRQADELFPGHSMSAEIAKTRSLVSYHKEVIHRASLELMDRGRLCRRDLLRLLEDA